MTATGGDTVKSLRSWAFGATTSGCSAHAENPSASAGRNMSFVYFILHLRTGLETKTGQASVSLSRFRDSLPSRHRRSAPHRAPGFIASELRSIFTHNGGPQEGDAPRGAT